MSHVPSDPELTAIESALKALSPSRSHLDRDRLMFRAGQVSAHSRSWTRWAWPSIAATLAIVAMSEGVLLATRPGPRVVERIVIVGEPLPPSSSQPESVVIRRENPPILPSELGPIWLAGSDSLRLRRQVLRFGLDGLPEPPPLLTHSGESPRTTDPTTEPSGVLRRYEYPKFLNPGGPS